jgi:hypothetical protein
VQERPAGKRARVTCAPFLSQILGLGVNRHGFGISGAGEGITWGTTRRGRRGWGRSALRRRGRARRTPVLRGQRGEAGRRGELDVGEPSGGGGGGGDEMSGCPSTTIAGWGRAGINRGAVQNFKVRPSKIEKSIKYSIV